MTKTKNTAPAAAPSDLDATQLAHLNLLKRQRERMARNLLKRRRQKSGQ